MDALAPFRIPIATLKADEASYNWELGPEFLALFDEDHEPINGRFTVDMELHKAGGITTLQFSVNGSYHAICDRCTASILIPVSGDYQMIVRIGDPSESTDEVVFMDPEASQLNVGKHIYDFILLSIPISQRIANCESMDDSPCDQSVLSYLFQIKNMENPGPGSDISPWDDLKKVIEN